MSTVSTRPECSLRHVSTFLLLLDETRCGRRDSTALGSKSCPDIRKLIQGRFYITMDKRSKNPVARTMRTLTICYRWARTIGSQAGFNDCDVCEGTAEEANKLGLGEGLGERFPQREIDLMDKDREHGCCPKRKRRGPRTM